MQLFFFNNSLLIHPKKNCRSYKQLVRELYRDFIRYHCAPKQYICTVRIIKDTGKKRYITPPYCLLFLVSNSCHYNFQYLLKPMIFKDIYKFTFFIISFVKAAMLLRPLKNRRSRYTRGFTAPY